MMRLLHSRLEEHRKAGNVSAVLETWSCPSFWSLDDFLRSPLDGVIWDGVLVLLPSCLGQIPSVTSPASCITSGVHADRRVFSLFLAPSLLEVFTAKVLEWLLNGNFLAMHSDHQASVCQRAHQPF